MRLTRTAWGNPQTCERRSITIDFDDSCDKGLSGCLWKIVPDAADTNVSWTFAAEWRIFVSRVGMRFDGEYRLFHLP